MKSRGKLIFASAVATAGALAAIAANRTVKRDVPMGPAIDAERRSIRTRTGGLASYYVDGSGAGIPIVLVHAIHAAASSYDMKPLFEAWRGKRPVIAVDLPGFGFSDRADRRYTPEFYAAFLAEFLEAVAAPYGQADVIALSLSCEFAAKAALSIPEVVRTLTFLSPTGFNSKRGRPAAEQSRSMKRSNIAFNVLSNPALGQFLFDTLSSRASLRYFLQKSFHGPLDESYAEYAYATSHQPGARHAPTSFVSGLLFDTNVRTNVYELLPMPVAILYDKDANVTFDELETTLSRHPNWYPARIAPTRGLPHFERIADTMMALQGFFDRIQPPADKRQTAAALPN